MTAAVATEPSVATTSPKAWKIWTGRVLGAAPVLMLLFSGTLKLSQKPMVIEGLVHKFGYPESTLVAIGLVEILCAILYVIPRTAILGAILVTGYLGGTIATHVRVGDVFVMPLLLGILAWAGLYLRDDRIAALIPLRKV